MLTVKYEIYRFLATVFQNFFSKSKSFLERIFGNFNLWAIQSCPKLSLELEAQTPSIPSQNNTEAGYKPYAMLIGNSEKRVKMGFDKKGKKKP